MTNRTDNFNRADSTTSINSPSDGGADWVVVTGTWGINTNRGYNVSASSPGVVYLESSVSDVDVQATTAINGANCFICARLVDGSNYLLGGQGDVGTVFIYKNVAGSFTSLASVGHTHANGDIFKFSVSGSSLTLFVNGVSTLTATDSAGSTNTKHGFYNFSDSTTRWDDFSITGTGGGGTSISATSAVETWAGQGSSLNVQTNVAASAGLETWSGKAATVAANTNVSALSALETWSGNAATVQIIGPTTITANSALETWSGQVASVQIGGVTAALKNRVFRSKKHVIYGG